MLLHIGKWHEYVVSKVDTKYKHFQRVLYEAYIPVYCSVGHNCLWLLLFILMFPCKKYPFNFHQTFYPKPECCIWIIIKRLIIFCVCFNVLRLKTKQPKQTRTKPLRRWPCKLRRGSSRGPTKTRRESPPWRGRSGS